MSGLQGRSARPRRVTVVETTLSAREATVKLQQAQAAPAPSNVNLESAVNRVSKVLVLPVQLNLVLSAL